MQQSFVLNNDTKLLRISPSIIKSSITKSIDVIELRGSYGNVYKVNKIDNTEYKKVAIKQFNYSNKKLKHKVQQQFNNEISILWNIDHKNIVKLHAYSTEKAPFTQYLIYDDMCKGTLYDKIHNSCKPLNWLQMKNIITEIVQGLQYLHKERQFPVVHCDITSRSILLDKKLTPKICSFGVAKEITRDEMCDKEVCQNLFDTSHLPKNFIEEGKLSTRVDIYSYGLMLYEIATGKVASRFKDDIPSLEDGVGLPIDLVSLHFESYLEKGIDIKSDEHLQFCYLVCLARICCSSAPEFIPDAGEIIHQFTRKRVNYKELGEILLEDLMLRPGPNLLALKLADIPTSFPTVSFSELEGTINLHSGLEIHKAKLKNKNDSLIIKTYKYKNDLEDNELRSKFLAEIKTLHQLKHDNVVTLCAYSADNIPCLLYENVPNGTLSEKLSKKSLPWKQIWNIARGIATGLDYLHNSQPLATVHGDIMSSSILLDKNFLPKIASFGQATEMDRNSAITNSIKLSLYKDKSHLPKEYIKLGLLSTKVEVYSFGLLLFEMVTDKDKIENYKIQKAILTSKYTGLGNVDKSAPNECKYFFNHFYGLALDLFKFSFADFLQNKFRACAFDKEIFLYLTRLAKKCSIGYLRFRPDMNEVTKELSADCFASSKLKEFSGDELMQITNGWGCDITKEEGYYGATYKGELNDKTVAIKEYKYLQKSKIDDCFINDLVIIGNIKHKNILTLYGYCFGIRPYLIFEYMSNGTLENKLYMQHLKSLNSQEKRKIIAGTYIGTAFLQKGKNPLMHNKHKMDTSRLGEYKDDIQEIKQNLDNLPKVYLKNRLTWEQRWDIVIGITQGLNYLHNDCDKSIFHCCLNSSSILLDGNLTPKLSNFELAKEVNAEILWMSETDVKEFRKQNKFFENDIYVKSEKYDIDSYGRLLVEMVFDLYIDAAKDEYKQDKFVSNLLGLHNFCCHEKKELIPSLDEIVKYINDLNEN